MTKSSKLKMDRVAFETIEAYKRAPRCIKCRRALPTGVCSACSESEEIVPWDEIVAELEAF